MTSPVPTHQSLEEINDKLAAARTADDAFYEAALSKLDSLVGNTENLNAYLSYFSSMLVDIRNILYNINGYQSDTVNQIKDLQVISLAGVAQCCDMITVTPGAVDNQCAKTQEMVDKLLDILSGIGLTASTTRLPTVQELIDAFTVTTGHGTVVLIDTADAARLLSAILQIGYGGIIQLGGINDDPILKQRIINNFATATSSADAASGMRQFTTTGYDEPQNVIYAAVVLFSSLSVVNHLWDEPAVWTGDGYDNGACGDEPPPTGEGFALWNSLTGTLTDVDEVFYDGATIDLDDPTSGNISPTPYDVPRGAVYVRACYNEPVVEGRNTNILLVNADDHGELYLEVPVGEELLWSYPSDRFVKIATYGTGGAPTGAGARLVFTWVEGETASHCTS